MTPKEKAEAIYAKFIKVNYCANSVNPKFRAIDACNILCDEMLSMKLIIKSPSDEQFWEDVKKEVESILK